MDHQHHAIDHRRENRRVGKGDCRRRIDDDVGESFFQLAPQPAHLFRTDSFSRISGHRTRSQNLQVWCAWTSLQEIVEYALTGEPGCQSLRVWYFKLRMKPRTS